MIAILVLAGLAVGGYRVFTNKNSNEAPTSVVETQELPEAFTAIFLIYTNNLRRDFSAAMYHRQSEAVYLTSHNPNQVQVEQPGVTWQEFFDTLPFSLDQECLVTGTQQNFCSSETQQLNFYLNGELEPQALEKVIQPDDGLLITFGPNDDPNIEQQLTQLENIKEN